MTWARLDDLYDDHPKLLAAVHVSPLAAAVHAHAITATARRETNGLVDPFWLLARVPDEKERTQTLSVLRELGLFDVLPAGESRELADAQGYHVTLGPWTEDRYLVHDYLDYNPSSVQLAERRQRDLDRKRVPNGTRADSEGIPPGIPVDSNGIPTRARSRGPARPVPKGTNPPTRGRATRPRKPSQRELDAQREQQHRQQQLCEQFPEVPPAVVLNAARRLSETGEPATVDAIRAELEL